MAKNKQIVTKRVIVVSKWDKVKKRLVNPVFLAAIAALLYRALQNFGIAPEAGDYQLYVDIICYILGIAGVYSTFDSTDPENIQNIKK